MKTTLILISIALIFSACTTQRRPLPPPQKGGGLTLHGKTDTNSVKTALLSVEAPENPKTPSTVNYEKTRKVERSIPAGSKVVQTSYSTNSMGHSTTNKTETTYADDVLETELESESAKASIGTSPEPASPFEEDPLEMLQARLDNMKPIMWFGIGFMVLAGGFCFWRGWITKGFIALGVGAAIVVLAQVIPGHEGKIVGTGIALFVLTCLLVLYVYYKGHFDANQNGIPDFLEKKK